MHVLLIALLAAVAMLAEDVVSVILVQAEARNRAHLAGLCDAAGWILAITTTFISVNTLQGHNFWAKAAVVVLVTAANYVGTVTGTRLGKRWVKEDATKVADSLRDHEARLAALESR